MKTFFSHTPKIIENVLSALKQAGYDVIGATAKDRRVALSSIADVNDLCLYLADEQTPGSYKLSEQKGDVLFTLKNCHDLWKQFLFPRSKILFQYTSDAGYAQEVLKPIKHAFLGIRPCDVASLSILDKVFLQGKHVDAFYRNARENLFILAADCTELGGNCFCHTMNTGPFATSGFDLAMTEMEFEGTNILFVRAGTEKGEALAEKIGLSKATDEINHAFGVFQKNVQESLPVRFELSNLFERLQVSYHSHAWAEIAQRCLGCGNCTLVCPTCFCSNVIEENGLGSGNAKRIRQWDSCYSHGFSYMVGGAHRKSRSNRYRQWLMHKFSNWHYQFGTYGCVGCGRCITWCPVGIDVSCEVKGLSHAN